VLVRLLVVVALVAVLAAAPVWYRRRQARLQRGPEAHPPVPAQLVEGAERTWLLFTTPWCVSCGPVEEQLRAADPEARVVKVDATRQPDLAATFSVRTAPTALLADRAGRVQARLVGLEAVSRYLVASP
jgi:thiol-disulfide isomerase/thioredoxin